MLYNNNNGCHCHLPTLNRLNNAFRVRRLHVHIFGWDESGPVRTLFGWRFALCVCIAPLVALCVFWRVFLLLCEWVARVHQTKDNSASAKGDDNENNGKHSKQFLILFFILRWRCRCGFLFAPLASSRRVCARSHCCGPFGTIDFDF